MNRYHCLRKRTRRLLGGYSSPCDFCSEAVGDHVSWRQMRGEGLTGSVERKLPVLRPTYTLHGSGASRLRRWSQEPSGTAVQEKSQHTARAERKRSQRACGRGEGWGKGSLDQRSVRSLTKYFLCDQSAETGMSSPLPPSLLLLPLHPLSQQRMRYSNSSPCSALTDGRPRAQPACRWSSCFAILLGTLTLSATLQHGRDQSRCRDTK